MRLNVENGTLEIGKYKFTSDFSLSEIETLSKLTKVNLMVNNEPYRYYQVPDLTFENAVAIGFKGNKITMIDIGAGAKFTFPPFQMTPEEKKQIKLWLTELGGSRSYIWGSVNYSEDGKGGIVSIIIKYNQEVIQD